MHKTGVMGMTDRDADIVSDGKCVRHVKRPFADEFTEVDAVHHLHDEIAMVGPGAAETEKGDDVGVIQLRHHVGFPRETLDELGVIADISQELDGHMAVKHTLSGLPNHTGTSTAYVLLEIKAWQLCRQLVIFQ